MSARDVLAQLRLPTGKLWIDAAEPWQLGDALNLLEGDRPYGWISRPRGGSKTDDAAGCGLAWVLSAPPGSRGYLAAADREQAAILLDRVRGYLDRTPTLKRRVELQAHRLLVPDSGASLETLPSDSASSWGLTPELLICDEFAYWSPTPGPWQFWESISSALAKSPTGRLLVISSPSSPTHPAYRVLEHARSDPMWWVSEQTGPPPWLSEERVAEQRRRLPEFQFARLFEGRWTEGTERLTTLADVRACVRGEGTLDPDSRHRYFAGLDIGIKRDRTAFAVGHRDGERVVIDLLAVWRPRRLHPVKIDEVEAYVMEACREYRASLIADWHQAAHLTQRLRARGVRVRDEHFGGPGNAKRAAVMVGLLRDRRLGLPNDEKMIEELANLMLVERAPGQFKIDHRPGKHDDRAQAIALVASELAHEPESRPAMSVPSPFGSRTAFSRWQREQQHERRVREAPAPAPPPPPPEPVRVGRFLIHPHMTRGGR